MTKKVFPNRSFTIPAVSPVIAKDIGSIIKQLVVAFNEHAARLNKMFPKDGTEEYSRTGTGALNFSNIGAGLSADLTITVTGAALGDTVILGVPDVSVLADSCYTAWVSSTDTVTVRFNNYSAGSLDPASGTFRADVFKH